MKPDGSDVKRLTTFEDYDVRWPALGDGKIVYQHKMDIWLYDLATGQNQMVPIQLPSDRLQVREKFVEPKDYLTGWALSKDGGGIALETRGDLFVARTQKKGLIRRLTEGSASRSRTPAFSPDGKNVAAWTEVDGEEQLLLHAADNSEAAKQIGTMPPGWHLEPRGRPTENDSPGATRNTKSISLTHQTAKASWWIKGSGKSIITPGRPTAGISPTCLLPIQFV